MLPRLQPAAHPSLDIKGLLYRRLTFYASLRWQFTIQGIQGTACRPELPDWYVL